MLLCVVVWMPGAAAHALQTVVTVVIAVTKIAATCAGKIGEMIAVMIDRRVKDAVVGVHLLAGAVDVEGVALRHGLTPPAKSATKYHVKDHVGFNLLG
jgi:hypothetical protein